MLLKKLIISFLIIILNQFCLAQVPIIKWEKFIGGLGYDDTHCIQATTDKGYILAGSSNTLGIDTVSNHGYQDCLIIKLDSIGNTLWQKSIGSSGRDDANYIQQTNDGGYIVAGYNTYGDFDATNNYGDYDYWIVKLNNLGDIIWQKSYGGSGIDKALSVQQTTEGGYIVAGFSASNDGNVIGAHGKSDYWILKLDNTGNLQWQKTLGGTKQDQANSVKETTDGGFIIAGTSWSSNGDVTFNHSAYSDYWIVKLSTTGNLQWQKSYGGEGQDEAKDIQQTFDGGYIITGNVESVSGDIYESNGDMDNWVLKIDSIGNIQWQKSLGGSYYELSTSIIQTIDTCYILTGTTTSNNGDITENHGYYDAWVVKLDSIGNLKTQQTFGGSGYDFLQSIKQTEDGNYIAAGWTDGDGISTNCWVVKFNIELPLATFCPGIHSGTAPSIKFQKSLGTIGNETAFNAQQTFDLGYIVVGGGNPGFSFNGNHGSYDCWIVKLNERGRVVWQKSLGGNDIDFARAVQQTSDSGFIIAASTRSNFGDVSGNHGETDYWIIKLDKGGNIKWKKTFGGILNDIPYSIQQTMNGGYIVAGASESNNGNVSGNHGDYDYWVISLDSNGNLLWQKSFGGTESDQAQSIQQTQDGGYIVAGYTLSNNGNVSGSHGSMDYWIIKLDSGGNLIWQKTFGGSYADYAFSIKQTREGGYIVTGETNSINGDILNNHGNSIDCWIVKLNAIGEIEWKKTFGGTKEDKGYDIIQTSDGNYVVVGSTESTDGDVTSNHGGKDFWIFQLDRIGNIIWQKSYGGSNDEIASSIKLTKNGGYVIAGTNKSNDGDISGNYGGQDYWLVTLFPEKEIILCPNPSLEVLYSDTCNLINSCKWQVDKGLGFVDIIDNVNYSGSSTPALSIMNVPTSWYGYRYQCIINYTTTNIITTTPITIKFSNTWSGSQNNIWDNPANWSCNSIPDINTDVEIPTGLINYPIVNSNTSIKSIKILTGATVSVMPGIILNISGK